MNNPVDNVHTLWMGLCVSTVIPVADSPMTSRKERRRMWTQERSAGVHEVNKWPTHAGPQGRWAPPRPVSAPAYARRMIDTRREILRLAIPAFLTLVAEPLFLLADSAIVGHLGTPQLAALGLASAALLTAAGLCIFLAYGTTASVSRAIGAGRESAALAAGLDGLWLALGLGTAIGALLVAAAEPICLALGSRGQITEYAVTYLRISALGMPALLATMAVTGILRGFQDTLTPLVASVAGFGANVVLNVALVYGLGWGIAGSAWGTVIAQTGMAAALVTIALHRAHAAHALGRPHPGGIVRAARDGVPLLIRTLALRATFLLTTWVAARLGEVPLAAYQVSLTVWTFLAYALDALAIAAQALTGRTLGAGDLTRTREATAIMVRWGIGGGAVIGALTIAASVLLPRLFTADVAVQQALVAAFVVIGLSQPICGHAFVLDGVIIGAGDNRWLAGAQVAVLAGYLPAVGAIALATPWLIDRGPVWSMVAIWVGLGWFMLLRSLILGRRARGDAWMRTGTA